MIRTCKGLLFACLLAGPSLAAPTVTIGSPSGLNVMPFGSGAAPNFILSQRYQQLFNASDFLAQGLTGPATLTTIFFDAGGQTFTNSLVFNPLITLSTTTAASLSATFASNIGPNETTVISGLLQLPLSSAGGSYDVALILQTPFVYDPTQGNLLLDIRHDSSYLPGLSSYFPANRALTYIAPDNRNSPNAFAVDNTGLTARFAFAGAPEIDASSSGLPLFLAVGLLTLTQRRRRA